MAPMARRTPRSKKPARSGHGLAVAGALAVVAAIAPVTHDRPPHQARPGPVDEGAPVEVGIGAPLASDALALIGGLAAGDSIGEWKVTSVGAQNDEAMTKAIAVRVEHRDGRSMSLWVARQGAHPFLPYRTSARYAFYYSEPLPKGTAVSPAELDALLDALSARVARVEADRDVPAQL